MGKHAITGAGLGAAVGFVVVLAALLALPALAESSFDIDNMQITHGLGNGSAVVCDQVAVSLDDTSVANTQLRWIDCTNPTGSGVTARIGGASVGANAAGLEPGKTTTLLLAKSVVPKCYASGPVTIQCTERY